MCKKVLWFEICSIFALLLFRFMTFRLISKIILAAALLIPIGSKAQDNAYDVFTPIAKYMAQGDAERLSAWFSDNLEITIFSTSNDSSRSQALQIMKSFFKSYTPCPNVLCRDADIHPFHLVYQKMPDKKRAIFH